MSELIWLPEALLDLTEHFEFLKLKNPEATGRVAQSIREASFSLAKIHFAERFFQTGAIAGN
jgi:plasmid stabilization system protein ParE